MMSNLKDEILGEMIKADNNGTIHSSNYGILTEIILSLIEKRIDEIHLPYFVGGQYTVTELNNLALLVIEKIKTEILLK